MKTKLLLITLALIAFSCREKEKEADAYGNFEADEVIISSETNGRIMAFEATEGSEITKNDIIAIIDSTLFCLQKAEIDAGMRAVRTKIASIDAQNEILEQQIENLNVNIKRTQNLLKDDAATTKQMDDLTGQAAVIERQIAASNTQKSSIQAELQVNTTRKATIDEQIRRCIVRSPLDGTLIQKYSEAGEITAAGKPLAKVADLKKMKLKVYVSGGQVGNIRTGQECAVRTDNGEKGFNTYNGIVSYISGKAEFTPKIIQTKEERVTLVYAVTIEVNNPGGTLKSGMPGEAIF